MRNKNNNRRPEKVGINKCPLCLKYKCSCSLNYCDECEDYYGDYIANGIKALIIIATIIFVAPAALASLTDDLISYYNFNENTGTTLNDSVGSNHLTASNAAIVGGAGINGQALNFSTGNHYAYKTSPTNIPAGSNVRSISFWINRDNLITNAGHITITTSSGQSFNIIEDTAHLFFTDGVNGNNNLALNGFYVNDVWINYVFMITAANKYEVYKNGTNITSTTNRDGIFGTNINTGTITAIELGRRGTVYTDASLDEIGIWSRVLTTAEISQLAAGNETSFYPFTTEEPPAEYYFNFSVKNDETSASINTFNATITYNNTQGFFSTTNGTIQTTVPENSTINITIQSSGYMITEWQDLITKQNYLFNITPIKYFTINSTNQIYSVNLIPSGGGSTQNFNTIDGEIITTIISNYGDDYNITGTATYYNNVFVGDYDTTNDLQLNFTPSNATISNAVPNPFNVPIGKTRLLNIPYYFSGARSYEIVVYYDIHDENGTTLGASTGNYSTIKAEYEVNLYEDNKIGFTGLSEYNYTVLIRALNIDNETTAYQTLYVFNIEETDRDTEILGFSFDTSDARFWLFIIISSSLIIGTIILNGYFIGYVGAIYFLYYSILFFTSSVPFVYSFIILCAGVLCAALELSSQK